MQFDNYATYKLLYGSTTLSKTKTKKVKVENNGYKKNATIGWRMEGGGDTKLQSNRPVLWIKFNVSSRICLITESCIDSSEEVPSIYIKARAEQQEVFRIFNAIIHSTHWVRGISKIIFKFV